MATTTRGAPSGTASVPGRNGNGVCQRPPYSEPPGSGKLSHPGSPILSQAGSPILSHPGAAIGSHPLGRDRNSFLVLAVTRNPQGAHHTPGGDEWRDGGVR